MRWLCFLALSLTAGVPAFAQTAANATPGLPSDPRAILATAAPFYDFNSPDMRPWHMKATYQLYDDYGKPTEQGTFEYWWASPTVNRTTWTRAGATHTVWHMAGGKEAYQDTGEPLRFFEYKLQNALFSPLPSVGEMDPGGYRLEEHDLGSKDSKIPCVMVVPLMTEYKDLHSVPVGLYPTYCFDPRLPVLRVSRLFGSLTTVYSQIVKLQNRFLAKDIEVFEWNRKILTAQMDAPSYMSATDPALTPPEDALVDHQGMVKATQGVMVGKLIKVVRPVYPPKAKEMHTTGRVILEATVGRDGGIHDLRVISAPSAALALSALWAVSQWQYKPYLLLGDPVEVQTTINVDYALGM